MDTGIFLFQDFNESTKTAQAPGDAGWVVGLPVGASGFVFALAWSLMFVHDGRLQTASVPELGITATADGASLRIHAQGQVDSATVRHTNVTLTFSDGLWPPEVIRIHTQAGEAETTWTYIRSQGPEPGQVLAQWKPAVHAGEMWVQRVPVTPSAWGNGRTFESAIARAAQDPRVRLFMEEHPSWLMREGTWDGMFGADEWNLVLADRCEWLAARISYAPVMLGLVEMTSGTDCSREIPGELDSLVVADWVPLEKLAASLGLASHAPAKLRYAIPTGEVSLRQLSGGTFSLYGEQWSLSYASQSERAGNPVTVEDRLTFFAPRETFASWSRDVH